MNSPLSSLYFAFSRRLTKEAEETKKLSLVVVVADLNFVESACIEWSTISYIYTFLESIGNSSSINLSR